LVRSTHRRTIEVTTESHLTERGDCIVGVRADKGAVGLRDEVKEAIKTPGSQITFRFDVGQESFVVKAFGSPFLTLSSHEDMVIRKSEFISPRTVGVRADGASADMPRTMVERLRTGADCIGTLTIEFKVAA
jgi:uncharacterized protein